MKKFHVGVQLYSVRDDLKKDFIGTLTKIRDIGYEYVEFAGYYGEYTGEELDKILKNLGLKSISVHQGLQMFLEQGQKAFDFFKAYGVHYIVIPWYESSLLPGSDKWEETKALFISVAKQAQANGMELLYHNHDFEFEKVGDECRYDIMFRELKGFVDPEPDVCWIHYGGQDPSAYLRKYGDRINVVHLKDFQCTKLASGPVYALIGNDGKANGSSREDNGFMFTSLGDGRNDWDSILTACSDIDATYVIVEQDQTYDVAPCDAVAKSRKFLAEKYGL